MARSSARARPARGLLREPLTACGAPATPDEGGLDDANHHADAVTDGRVDGDWSKFPDYVQCLVGVQVFYPAMFGVYAPSARDAWTGDCAPEGACHLWLDDIPNEGQWERIESGARAPSLYDLAVYPPVTYANGKTNPYGHVAIVDHVGDDGTVYVMDANWNGDERKASLPHATGPVYEAYGYYHLRSLPVEAPTGGCNGVDYSGYCDEKTVVWCEDGALKSKDCGAQGQACGWESDAVGNNCVAPAADDCAALGEAGTCDGTVLSWCVAGEIQTYDCSKAGMSCGYQNDVIGYNCL